MPCRCARRPFRHPTHRSRRLGRPVGLARLRFPHFCALDAGNASDVGVKSASSSSAPGIFTPSVLFVRCSARFSSALRLPRFSFAWFARVGRPSRRLARGVHSFYSFVLFVRFIRWFAHPFAHSFARSLAGTLARSLAGALGRLARSLTSSFACFIRWLARSSMLPYVPWQHDDALASFGLGLPRARFLARRLALLGRLPRRLVRYLMHMRRQSAVRSFARSFHSLAPVRSAGWRRAADARPTGVACSLSPRLRETALGLCPRSGRRRGELLPAAGRASQARGRDGQHARRKAAEGRGGWR